MLRKVFFFLENDSCFFFFEKENDSCLESQKLRMQHVIIYSAINITQIRNFILITYEFYAYDQLV